MVDYSSPAVSSLVCDVTSVICESVEDSDAQGFIIDPEEEWEEV